MVHLPTASTTNTTGRRGVTILQETIEAAGWLFRRQDGDTDFGVDAEIEVVSQNLVTGYIFKAQIKSTNGIDWTHGDHAVQIRVSTYNLWTRLPNLILLFLVDVDTKEIFWTPAFAHHPRSNADSITIKFEHASRLDDHITALRRYLASWFRTISADAVLREVPYYNQVAIDLANDVDHYDDWCSMDPEEEGQFQRFYHHALRLRCKRPPEAAFAAGDQGIWLG